MAIPADRAFGVHAREFRQRPDQHPRAARRCRGAFVVGAPGWQRHRSPVGSRDGRASLAQHAAPHHGGHPHRSGNRTDGRSRSRGGACAACGERGLRRWFHHRGHRWRRCRRDRGCALRARVPWPAGCRQRPAVPRRDLRERERAGGAWHSRRASSAGWRRGEDRLRRASSRLVRGRCRDGGGGAGECGERGHDRARQRHARRGREHGGARSPLEPDRRASAVHGARGWLRPAHRTDRPRHRPPAARMARGPELAQHLAAAASRFHAAAPA